MSSTPGPDSSEGERLLCDPAIRVRFRVQPRSKELEGAPKAIKCATKISQKIFCYHVYQLVNHTIYWTRKEADFLINSIFVSIFSFMLTILFLCFSILEFISRMSAFAVSIFALNEIISASIF